MNDKLSILEGNLYYKIRSSENGTEYLKFKSDLDLDIEIGETSEKTLISLRTENAQTFFSVMRSKVIEITEDDESFTYKVTGKINCLSKWEFELVKKEFLKNAERESNTSS